MIKIKLNSQEQEQISNAVKSAEGKTSGEIATALIRQSDDYAVYELLFAVACGFFYFNILLFFQEEIKGIISNMFWDFSPVYPLMFYGFSTFLVIFLVYLLVNIPFCDRLLVPKSIMIRKVRERALRHFVESGVYHTRDRTGILIFISALERRVELLADTGINEKISQEKWDAIVQSIIVGIKTDKLVDHLTSAVLDCGKLLEENFPIAADDTNELKDGIEILEK